MALVVALALYAVAPRSAPDARPGQGASLAREDLVPPTLSIGDAEIVLLLARTPAERTRGLSGRERLAEGQGMLFIYEREDRYGFWMPDMRFSIDIIWLDADMRVVDVKENATPESYPEVFEPKAPALYVLEVPAGYAAKYGIVEGVQGVLTAIP